MKQQYIILSKENDLLNSLIGQSFNQRTKFEADKILKEIHKQADQYSMEKAMCYVIDKGEIKGVGGSSLMQNKKTGEIVSDLVLNNFGILFAGVMSRFRAVDKIVSLINKLGAPITLKAIGTSTTFPQLGFGGIGNSFQVGSGSTAPDRADFDIETAFGTAPEDTNMFPATDPVFNSGLGNFKMIASITAGGAGTINESIWIGRFLNTSNGTNEYAFFRDIISPAVAFIAGQTIALEYTVQL